MSSQTSFKRFKRRFKKKLYHTLLALNKIDFSKYRFVWYILIISGMLLALTKLPTSEASNLNSEATAYGAGLSASVRQAIATDSAPVDVVALFLPKEITAESTADLSNKTLYSFYLTGKELAYLAEGAVSANTKGTLLYLDGLKYTYHKNRLPFDRITALSTVSGTELTDTLLYHVVGTEDLFALFHYISYRSIGIMEICPKDMTGSLLSDYQKVLSTESGLPSTLGMVLTAAAAPASLSATASVVTVQSGFNLISLLQSPGKITICVIALFITLLALLWYMLPRLRRIRLWIRIYRFRCKKRSTHTIYWLKKRY